MISKRISDDIPPQRKILNMIIPILMFYYHFPFKKTVKMFFVAPTSNGCQLHKTACQLHIFTCKPMKSDRVLTRILKTGFIETLEFLVLAKI